MRLSRPAALLFVCALSLVAQETKITLKGIVVRAGTGEPLKKVTVRLEPIGQVNGVTVAYFPNGRQSATITGADGAFRFDELVPGVYRILASRVGYLDSTQPPLRIGAGSEPKPVSVPLTPHSLLYGRVLDSDGDPVPTASVQVFRSHISKGKRQFETVNSTQVQADGSFVIGGLKPGKYYANASAPRDGNAPPDADLNVPTWFPTAIDPSLASPIQVAPGAEVRGVEVRMRKTRVFRVSGKAMDMDTGGPAKGISLTISARGPDGEMLDNASQTTGTGDDGTFHFEGVAPGHYVLQTAGGAFRVKDTMVFFSGTESLRITGGNLLAMAGSDKGVGRTEVDVADDTAGVLIRISRGAEVTGLIRTEDGSALAGTNVQLSDEYGNSTNVNMEEGYKFSGKGLIPAIYKVSVNGIPDGAYLKTIRFAGKDVADAKLDLASGVGGDVEMILSPKGAVIAGVVHSAGGDPMPGVMVQIYQGDEVVHQLETDTNGAFRLNGLAPGDYRAIAWEQIEDDLLGDADFRGRFDAQSAQVKLAEGERQGIELKIVTKEAIESEAAKVR